MNSYLYEQDVHVCVFLAQQKLEGKNCVAKLPCSA